MRTIPWVALVTGASYCFAAWSDCHGPAVAMRKGAGVALLALWAAGEVRSTDGWLLVAVMLLGATGDVLLDALGIIAGACAFLGGNIIAIALYLRNQRARVGASQLALALLVAPLLVVIAWLMTYERAITFYSARLGLMAALAWTSRFLHYRVGVGRCR